MVPRPGLKLVPAVKNQSARLTSELTIELEDSLLRGVPLHVCLGGFARHWDVNKENLEDFALSQPSSRFNAFLSHDWGTSRWLKLLAMLVVFNAKAAAVATTLASVLGPLIAIFALNSRDALGPMLFGFFTFWFFLCFWQRVRQLLRVPIMVFMDKLCISQKNLHLKERGILGLASFLDHADCLTILWSSRYFSRLWCTFEVAAFLRRKEAKRIKIMPVSFALLLFLINLVAHVGALFYYTFTIRSDVWTWLAGATRMQLTFWVEASILSALFLPLAASLGPLIFYIGIGLMKDIDELLAQLRCFSVEQCKCYCCTIAHQDPSTGLQIACDRELIFATLQEWYGDEQGCFVGPFDLLVKNHLARVVKESLMDVGGQLRHGVRMVVVILMPLLPCFLMPVWDDLQGWSDGMLLVFFLRSLLDWAKLPLVAALAFWIALRNMKLGLFLCNQKRRHLNQFTVSCLMTILTIFLLSIAWLPFEVVFLITRDDQSFFPVIPFVVLLMVDVCIFVPAARPLRIRWTHDEPEPSPSDL